jgi:FdhD protein
MQKEVTFIRMDRNKREVMQGEVAREYPLTVMLNDEQLATLLCSPDDMENLAAGFLYSEGLIRTQEEIKGITLVGYVRGGHMNVYAEEGRIG